MVLPLNGGSSGGGGFTGSWDVELPSDWDKPTTGSTDNKITQVDNRVRTLRTSTDNSFKNVKARFEMVEYNIGQILSRLSSAESQIANNKNRIDIIASRSTNNANNITSLFSNDNVLNNSISSVQNRVSTLESNVSSLISDVTSGSNRIVSTLEKLYGYTSGSGATFEHVGTDSVFVKFIKAQNRRWVIELTTLFNGLFSYEAGYGGTLEHRDNDSVAVKFFKGFGRAFTSNINTNINERISNFRAGISNDIFSYEAGYGGSLEHRENDSVAVKFFKGFGRAFTSNINTNINERISSFRAGISNDIFSYEVGYGGSLEHVATDSVAVKFFKGFGRAFTKILNDKAGDISDITNLNILNQTSEIKKINDVWKTNDPSGIVSSSDGDAAKLFKSLFKGLRDHLTDRFANLIDSIAVLFEAYFGANPDGATGYFSKLLEDQIYRLRYTIIEEFDSINEWLSIQVDWLETLSAKFTVGNGLLDTIAGWLKLIYEKPAGEITIPPNMNIPFDFDRLEEILDRLSFGNIVNEAGTNIWDFLSELIGSLTDLLGKILDMLDGLLDDILGLLIPKNLDFMYNRFNSIGDKFQVKFNFIFGGVDAIKNIFGTSQAAFEDIDFSIGFIDGVSSVKLPTSKINDFAVYLKPILTGFLVLDFLISMYKWFHERGQVVE